MKKHLLILFVAMFAAAWSLNAQTIVINEGFENGIQDSVWTQEYVVGETPWAVESVEDNLAFPTDVWQGSKRAYLRNTTGVTQGFKTRLVSKVMDLSPNVIYQPEMTFWYANPKWTADRDTLRVLYKTGHNADWKQLAEFSTASATWQKVTLVLPEVNSTYQIAFEGTDNLGRGIVLDSIKLRSAPECTIPYDINATSLGNGKVNITWNASWDADAYELIVTKDSINPDTVASIPDSLGIVVIHEQVDGLKQNAEVQLTSGEYYYVYVRSLCFKENSAWNSEDPNQNGAYYFRVKATKYLPYSYNFNKDYNAGKLGRDAEWTWGNNTGNYNPFISTHLNATECAQYSNDGTMSLVFTGTNSATTAIPAGKYAYVATPALDDTTVTNFSLSTCQVSFWATVHKYTGRNYAHSIIVGVMTDPEDVTTFVPVDTVSVWGTSTFQECIVDLAPYQGEGTYVAFASNFDKQNIFYIDNLLIQQKPAVNKVTKIYVNPRDTYANITWEGNAKSYNVLITSAEVENPSNPKAELVVEQATVNTNEYKATKLEADHSWNRPYYVYIQAEGTAWSYRYPFVTIASAKELPYEFDMEQASGAYYIGDNASKLYPNEIGIFSNDPDYPSVSTSNPYKGSTCLYLTKDPGNDSWVTFPMVDSIQNKQMMFFLSGNTTPAQVRATVGVMTNPMDINTFEPVSEFLLSANIYTRCYVNFANYKGEEGVIAIVWSDVEGMELNTNNYIDNVVIEEIASCLPPRNIQVEAFADSLALIWDKSIVNEWEVILTKKRIYENQLEGTADKVISTVGMDNVLAVDTFVWADTNTDPVLSFGGLNWYETYYVYLRSVCGEEETWWLEVVTRTACPEMFSAPYVEDFEEGEGMAIGCWQGFDTGSGYPKIMSTPNSGRQSLELWSTTTTHRSWIVAPKVDLKLEDMMIEYYARSYGSTTKTVLYTGFMTDPTDTATFIPVDTFYIANGSKFYKHTIDMAPFKEHEGKYIAITTGLATTLEMNSDVYIDDIAIKNTYCAAPFDITATDIEKNSIDIEWKGRTDDKWQVTVLDKYAPLDTDSNRIAPYDESNVIVKDTILTNRALHVEGLKSVTKYYFYIRPTCGDSIWAMDSIKSGCQKINPNVPNKETFESYPSSTSYKVEQQADCWIGGNGNPKASTSYLPYIYKSTTYANSGENSYKIYGYQSGSTDYTPAWIASPEIDCQSMNDLLVSFTYYMSTTSTYALLYGVMTDPEDLSTFVVLDSVKGTGTFVPVNVDLSEHADSIPAGAKYFAWRTPYGTSTTAYIDDVSIITMKCPIVKPSYSELQAESVRISSGLRVNNPWTLLITTKEIPADSLNTPGFTYPDSIVVYKETISARSKVVTGLTGETEYYVAVASVCEDSEPYWVTTSFLTPCKPITPEALGTITFSKDEGYIAGSSAARYLPCWTIGSKTPNLAPSSGYIPYVGETSTYLRNDHNYLYLYSYIYTTSHNDGAYAIMPTLDVDSIKDYQVNFFARGNTSATANSQVIVGIITDPSDLNTFVVVDTLTLNKQAYEPFTISFENYQGDYLGNAGKNIMFLGEFGVTNYAYISEISVTKIPACPAVKEIEVDSIGGDFAYISWESNAPKARLLFSTRELADSLKADYVYLIDTIVTNYDSVRIDNLTPSTQYFAYVQNLCEDENSEVSMKYARFLTDCPQEGKGFKAPYFNDFDATTATGSGNKPDCWTGVYLTHDTVATTQTYPYVNTTASNAYSGSNSMYMYSYWYSTSSNNKTIAVAPLVQGNLSDYMISFYAKRSGTTTSYGGKLLVGYVTNTDPQAINSTFVLLDSVMVEDATQKYYDLSLADKEIPEGARIALKADHSIQGLTGTSRYASFYIDNFRIGLPPTCYPPTIEAGKTTLNTAEVNITPYEEGNNLWQLAVIPDSIHEEIWDIKQYLDTMTTYMVTADSANFVVSGLDHSTTYQIYARTMCGGDDGNSAWTDNPISTITQYFYKDAYFFGFETSEEWIRSYLSTNDDYYLHPALRTGYQGGSNATSYSYYPYSRENTSSYIYSSGPKDSKTNIGALCMYATTSYYGAYIIFPSITEPKDRSFSFKMRPGYLSEKTMKVSTTYATRIQVGTIDKGEGFETFQPLAEIEQDVLKKTIVATEANNFLYTNYTLDVDSATLADKQIVIYQPEPPTTSYAYIDNVELGEAKGFGLVSILGINRKATEAEIIWGNIDGPWNLVLTTYNETTKETDTVATYTNLNKTSLVVTGLQPQTTYGVTLSPVNAPENSSYELISTKTFTTPCLPIEPNAKGEFFWDFNNPAEWEQSDVIVGNDAKDTAYYKPECFTTATTYTNSPSTSNVYYNWFIQRKGCAYTAAPTYSSTYVHYEYGVDDSPCLKVYSGSSTSSYMTPYIVLPELNCSFDTMMIEFYGRCFANYDATYSTVASQNKMVSATYLGASYSKSIVVGTLTDPNDFSTLEVIDTLTYNQSNLPATTKVTDDPTGLRYWEKMQLPLASAKGKYIVLFQPAKGLFFLDNLSVKAVGDNIFAPKNPTVDSITLTSAQLSWEVKHPSLQSVLVLSEGELEILRDTIVGTTYTVNGLKPATTYQWYIYQTNGVNNSSRTEQVSFLTECLPIDPSYTTSFEVDEGFWLLPGQTSATYKQNICWVYGNAGSSGPGTSSYNYASTATAGYAHDGAYAARLYAYSTTQQTYLAMPAIADIAAYDTLQVNFWMRPGYHNPTTGQISTQYTLGTTASTAEYYYSKSVIVGTMTDPDDPTTFVPIDTIGYEGTFAKGDAATRANDYLFQKKKVSLRGATGPYVAFMTTLYAKGETRKATYDYMWLDDISFSLVQECATPSDLTAENVLSDAATLNWQGAATTEKFVLQVSTDPNFYYDTAFVYNDTLTENTYTLTGLKPNTTYVWRVQAICNEEYGESEFTQKNTFTTARIPFFLEDFRETALDPGWAFGTTPAIQVIDSLDVEIEGDNNTSYGFKRVTTNHGIYGAHYASPFYSSSTVATTTYDNYWFISPAIYLEPTKTAHLTLDMALTKSSVTTPSEGAPEESEMADDYTFMIAISDDGGKTWKSENAKVWNNTLPAGNQLRDIPSEAENLRIDLAEFAGKNIKFAFYREATTYKSATCAIHIGNIRVAYYDNFEVDMDACQYEDVDAYGIFVNGDEVEPGEQQFMRVEQKGENDALIGQLDTVYNLMVNYILAPETIIADTICEGESYTSVDFNGKSKPGVYRHKMQSALSCDSIVTLHLSVTPTLRAEDQIITLCQGDTYTWNSKEYNRAGIYRDTTLSSLGCDSIETLVLSYHDAEDTIYVNAEVDITELPYTYESIEYPYAPGQAPIFYPTGTAKGVYVDTVLVQGVNCTAVLVHTLTVTNRHEGIEDIMSELGAGARKVLYQDNMYIICKGEWYTATGQRISDPRK